MHVTAYETAASRRLLTYYGLGILIYELKGIAVKATTATMVPKPVHQIRMHVFCPHSYIYV